MAKKITEIGNPFVKTKTQGDGWTSKLVSPTRVIGRLRVWFGKTSIENVYSKDGYTFASLVRPTKAEWMTMTGEVKPIEIKEWK